MTIAPGGPEEGRKAGRSMQGPLLLSSMIAGEHDVIGLRREALKPSFRRGGTALARCPGLAGDHVAQGLPAGELLRCERRRAAGAEVMLDRSEPAPGAA